MEPLCNALHDGDENDHNRDIVQKGTNQQHCDKRYQSGNP